MRMWRKIFHKFYFVRLNFFLDVTARKIFLEIFGKTLFFLFPESKKLKYYSCCATILETSTNQKIQVGNFSFETT